MDESWLTGRLATRVAPTVERWLPQSWSANVVTLVGSGLMWAWLVGAAVAPAGWRETLGWLWVIPLWMYCVLDHVDGCRARMRGTSAPWGEFLDHALDAWHVAILVVATAAVSGTAVRPTVVVMTLASAGIATVATWLDQKWRGEIFLGKLGPVESVALAGIFVGSHAVPGAAAWWRASWFAGVDLTRAESVFLLSAGGALMATAMAVRRAPGTAGRLVVFLAASVAVIGSGAGGVSWWVVVLALALATADASARVLVSHLARQPAPWPDVGGATLLVVAASWPEARSVVSIVALAWLGLRVGMAWRTAARTLPAR